MRGRELLAALSAVLFAFFLMGTIFPLTALAQEVSPTPETSTPLPGPAPAGSETVIPEIPTDSPVLITYPVHGLKLTGVVKITGTVALTGWTSYELAFSYASDATGTWFNFVSGGNTIPAGGLGDWDTTKLSDGDYNLRLRVFTAGGPQDGFAYGLRVRNYTADTPVPTLTFTPTATSSLPTSTPVPTFTPSLTPTDYPTPTALPPNPAALGPNDILANLAQGALIVVFLFGAFGAFLYLRRR